MIDFFFVASSISHLLEVRYEFFSLREGTSLFSAECRISAVECGMVGISELMTNPSHQYTQYTRHNKGAYIHPWLINAIERTAKGNCFSNSK
ncbi:hypothetical protein BABINDRAFT_109105 [Babjeviella inositovora NRRL Y-12698]|uniref:Uncharacterized protein n=1 Tax=Babjeviella inositovora NRRL Y-12698 TaxID=984486 RepID=A0A1E3QVA5_9ASCO|nr:uncharacterized protein BABINDRAFT_109105 [Babjeviella inositovora NRRL Y-12698]ODQ81591.1 hypothetical protein BABINDRAFT_109105 [Babjeviella inositovora NRRL Y-12698]